MTKSVTISELKQSSVFINNTYKKALIPCLLSILSANINVIVDGIFLGQKLGTAALAAISICLPFNLLLCVVGSFFSSGTAINASKELARTSKDRANDYYNANLVFTYIAAIIITFTGVIFLNQLCRLMCSNNDTYPYVREYMLVLVIGSIFKLMLYIPFWYLRLEGKNKEIMNMMIILTVGNIVLDVLLIFVFDQGVFGASLANVVSTALGMAYGFIKLRTRESNFSLNLKIDWKHLRIKRILADGVPSSLNNLCCAFRLLIVTRLFLSYGGTDVLAMFTAVFGVFSIGECIFLGISQASTAMLGVYSGERDNYSSKLIIKTELKIGAILSTVFLLVSVASSPLVANIYFIEKSLFLPILFMALSIFPAVITQALSGYYNIEGKNILSNIIIVLKLVVFVYIGIKLAYRFNYSEFSFFLFAEIATLLFILIYTTIYTMKHKDVDRFLLCKMIDEKAGKVINFTVENNNQKICEASESVSEFCQNNGMSIKDTMKIQLAIEEALVLVSQVNSSVNETVSGYDIRGFVFDDVTGIRIRYDGLDFNPFEGNMEGTDYMGIKMISDLLELTTYKRTFGVNTLVLLLKAY